MNMRSMPWFVESLYRICRAYSWMTAVHRDARARLMRWLPVRQPRSPYFGTQLIAAGVALYLRVSDTPLKRVLLTRSRLTPTDSTGYRISRAFWSKPLLTRRRSLSVARTMARWCHGFGFTFVI